jgi:hypothetical protein
MHGQTGPTPYRPTCSKCGVPMRLELVTPGENRLGEVRGTKWLFKCQSDCRGPVRSFYISEPRRNIGAIAFQKPFPRFAVRTGGQALAHSDDLHCVPSAASRRRNIALVERCGGRSRGQRGEFTQDRPKSFGAVHDSHNSPILHAYIPMRISFLGGYPHVAAADKAIKKLDHQPVEIEDQSRPWDFLTAAFLSFVRRRQSPEARGTG